MKLETNNIKKNTYICISTQFFYFFLAISKSSYCFSDNPSAKKQGRPSILRSLRRERPRPPVCCFRCIFEIEIYILEVSNSKILKLPASE